MTANGWPWLSLAATTQPASSITVRETSWSCGSWSTAATGAAAAAPKLVNASASTPRTDRIAECARKRLTARLSARRRFELLHATFQLIQPLVGPLRGLIGGLRALGRALHARVELIEARVDPREVVIVGGAGTKAQGGDDRHARKSVW